jgi:hypothetical protein
MLYSIWLTFKLYLLQVVLRVYLIYVLVAAMVLSTLSCFDAIPLWLQRYLKTIYFTISFWGKRCLKDVP